MQKGCEKTSLYNNDRAELDEGAGAIKLSVCIQRYSEHLLLALTGLQTCSHEEHRSIPPSTTSTNTTTTHTRARAHMSKSLACMTGDGPKQIMVIDRSLEMDLCACLCVSEQGIGTKGGVQKTIDCVQ